MIDLVNKLKQVNDELYSGNISYKRKNDLLKYRDKLEKELFKRFNKADK